MRAIDRESLELLALILRHGPPAYDAARTVAESFPFAVEAVDADGVLTVFNSGYARLSERDAAAVLGQEIGAAWPGFWMRPQGAMLRRAMDGTPQEDVRDYSHPVPSTSRTLMVPIVGPRGERRGAVVAVETAPRAVEAVVVSAPAAVRDRPLARVRSLVAGLTTTSHGG